MAMFQVQRGAAAQGGELNFNYKGVIASLPLAPNYLDSCFLEMAGFRFLIVLTSDCLFSRHR